MQLNYNFFILLIIFIENSFKGAVGSDEVLNDNQSQEDDISEGELIEEERYMEHGLEIKENRLYRKGFPTKCHGIYQNLSVILHQHFKTWNCI